MANPKQRIPALIKKLDAAIDALDELGEYCPENERGQHIDSRYQLKSQLREYADYLEKATWWRK